MAAILVVAGLGAGVGGAAFPPPLHAQDATDILTGRVLDATGRPVPDAEVVVTSLLTEIARRTLTGSDGRYVLLFPDGGGRYQMTVRALGLAERTLGVAREGVEEVLITEVRLAVEGVTVAGLDVQGRRAPPGAGDAGAREITLPQRLLDRLPLPDFDPALVAALSPNVILTSGDTASELASFSVAGQRDALNQITLDGGSISSVLGSQGSMGLPEEGVRATQVVTSTYDVSRGQFSGGLVAMTSARGVNRTSGSGTYHLQSPHLASGNGSFVSGGSSQHRLSGGLGGPLRQNRLFYNVSFQAQRRADDLFALVPDNEVDALALGAHPDSVARFLDILDGGYGVGREGQVGPYDRTADGFTVLGRVDFEGSERHSVMLRANGSRTVQDNAMVSVTELLQNGGETTSSAHGAQVGVTSRLGGAWIHQLRVSVAGGDAERTPYVLMPEGRVELGSRVGGAPGAGAGPTRAGGGVGLSTFVFGGDGSTPSSSGERTFELTDELSFLLGFTHRLKVGALVRATSYDQESGANTLGRFVFPSLAALEAREPSLFTRALAPQTSGASTRVAALWLGDTWRPSDPLQVTVGARAEYSSYDAPLRPDPTLDAAFGVRSGGFPDELHVSPRVGFSLRLSERGDPLRQITGGVGDFRGQPPLTLFGSTLGDLALQSRLVCVGSAVPLPDWSLFAADPGAVPGSCAAGAPGSVEASAAPDADVVSAGFEAPRSWRASLGYQAQIGARLMATAEVMHTRGVSLYGVRDLNLDVGGATTLEGEGGRPFYGDPSAVVARTGEVSFASSRLDSRYGHVLEIHSGQRSSTTQATLALGGLALGGALFQVSYTWTRSRDESSFSSGRATQGFAQTVTASNPNEPAWAVSDFERRHALTGYLIRPFASWLDVSLIGRLTSGAPFTPEVGGDVNGDGMRNDAAFVFDPGRAGTELAAGMRSVLDAAPDRVRSCLEEQLGSLAARNSCREPWTASLDLSLTLRPNLPLLGIGDRLALQLDVQNVPAGLDHLLHSDAELRGWGRTGRSDRTLLRPVGYDAAAETFRYAMNERFGQAVASAGGGGGRGAFGAGGFRVYVSGRLALGADLPGFGGARSGIGGGRGGFGGVRGGGALPGVGRGGAGGAAGLRGLLGRGGAGAPGSGVDATRLVERALANPIPVLLELADTLGLTEEQRGAVHARAAELDTLLAPLVERLATRLAEMPQPTEPQAAQALLRELQPVLQEGRTAIADAMADVQWMLTEEQWRRVPAAIRNVGRPRR